MRSGEDAHGRLRPPDFLVESERTSPDLHAQLFGSSRGAVLLPRYAFKARADALTRISLQSTWLAVTDRTEERERDIDLVHASLPSERNFLSRISIATWHEAALRQVFLECTIGSFTRSPGSGIAPNPFAARIGKATQSGYVAA